MTTTFYFSFNSLLKMDTETKRARYKAMLRKSGMGAAEFLGLVERYVATYGEVLRNADKATKYTFAAQAIASAPSQAEQMVCEEEKIFAEAQEELLAAKMDEMAEEQAAEYRAHLEVEAEIEARTGTNPWRW